MDITNLINLGMLIASAIAAIIAYINAKSSKESAKESARVAKESLELQGIFNYSEALRSFVFDEYVERKFKSTEPPIINGEEVTSLRRAKNLTKEEWGNSPEEWDKKSQFNNDNNQNKIAFETACALQHLGLAAFTGIVPLRFLLVNNADVIIDDWLICRSWVESYRGSEQTKTRIKNIKNLSIDYHRRHAEWIALVSAKWMYQHWSYGNAEKIIQSYGKDDKVSDKILAIIRADGTIMPHFVRRDLFNLIKIRSW